MSISFVVSLKIWYLSRGNSSWGFFITGLVFVVSSVVSSVFEIQRTFIWRNGIKKNTPSTCKFKLEGNGWFLKIKRNGNSLKKRRVLSKFTLRKREFFPKKGVKIHYQMYRNISYTWNDKALLRVKFIFTKRGWELCTLFLFSLNFTVLILGNLGVWS